MFKAQSFLHHMVRNIVGVLVPIGDGRQPVSWALDVLESRDRTQGGGNFTTRRPLFR